MSLMRRRKFGSMLFQAAQPAYAITYATWSAADKQANITLDATKLIAQQLVNANYVSARATIGKSSGKFVFEIQSSHSSVYFGFANGNAGVLNIQLSNAGTNDSAAYRAVSAVVADSAIANGFLASGSAPTYTANTNYMIALDLDSKKAWICKGGVWANSGDPAAGTNPSWTWVENYTIFPACSLRNTSSETITANFGASAFTNTVPSGFNAGWFV